MRQRPASAKGAVVVSNFSPSPTTRVEAIRAEFDGHQGWGVLYKQEDQQSRGLQWVSDLALVQEPDGKCYASFSQLLGREDGGMAPMQRSPGRPRIVRTLVREFTAYSGGIRLSTSSIPLRDTEEDVSRFIKLLEFPTRAHPVVLVSVHQQSGGHFVSPGELADHLSGIAHVVAADNPAATSKLSRHLPRWLTCFDGAIRVYWPGFSRTSQKADHRLWTVSDLARIQFDSGRFADLVLADIAAVSVNSISPHYCSLDRLQSLDRRRIMAQAKDDKEWKALADLYAEDNAAKESLIAGLERELKEKTEALFQEKQMTATLKLALEDRKRGGAGEAEEQLPVESVAEAISRAQDRFGRQLAFALNGRSDENSPYAYPEEVWAAFEWLAVTYFKAKTKAESCPDFNASVGRSISGWDYSGHQNEATMKANEDWYRCAYDGRRPWIQEHLKSGTSRDAAEAIRIAFCWDEKTQKVVIGFIGQHQRNAHTN